MEGPKRLKRPRCPTLRYDVDGDGGDQGRTRGEISCTLSARNLYSGLADSKGLTMQALRTALAILELGPLPPEVGTREGDYISFDKFCIILQDLGKIPPFAPSSSAKPADTSVVSDVAVTSLNPEAPLASSVQVFLGGACNPTTWRQRIAMPFLQKENITFYNPQVKEWSPDLVPIEESMKSQAKILLFVIGAQTRSIASMVEAAEYIASKRRVVLIIEPVNAEQSIFGCDEIGDLSRGRSYLDALAHRHGVPVFSTLEQGLEEIKHLASESACH